MELDFITTKFILTIIAASYCNAQKNIVLKLLTTYARSHFSTLHYPADTAYGLVVAKHMTAFQVSFFVHY